MSNVNVLKGSLLLTLSSFVFMVSGYLINIWLGKNLGIENYGIYGVIISLMTTINIIQTSGLPQAASKFLSTEKYDKDQILAESLRLQIISTFILTLIFILFAPLISSILNDNNLTNYIRLTGLILPFYSIFTLYIGYYNGLHQFDKQAILYISYSISKFILVIGLVYLFGLYGAILGFILSPIIALLFGFYLPNTNILSQSNLRKSLILLSLPLIGYSILSTLQLSIDIFFVKSIIKENLFSGLYTAGQNITRIPFYTLSAFSLILLPIITRSIHHESIVETGYRIRKILRNLYLLLFPGTILIALTSTPLLKILYSTEYTNGSSSVSLLVFGLGFLTVLNALTYILVGADRPGTTMVISGIGVIITSIVCWFAIPKIGLMGAALGTTIGAVITTLIAFIVVSKQFPGITPWKSLINISIASIGIYLTYLPIGNYFQTVWTLPVLYIILTLVYGIILFILKEIGKDDIQSIKELLKRNKEIENINPVLN